TVTTAPAALTDSEIAQGLKEALKVGSNNASQQLSALDGFNKNNLIRIPFPKDAQVVADKLRSMGYGAKVDEFETTLNRAAEQASKDAANIFVNAITAMTITDAKNILQGSNNAATTYLKNTTSDQLKTAFKPHIEKALNSTLATSKWKELTTLYNRVPFVKPVNTDLVGYTNDRAITGLFTVVEQEESKIRLDPAARVNDILKRVFGSK
ncbi:MAG TPA: DUF4197 domain-containing protein, partial [Cytophagales bacterium]|nr:DUF4197 domain-containing protein [Cytophagales bacterium]